MSSIAEIEMASRKVEQSDKEGHEHTPLIILSRQGLIDEGADFSRHHILGGQRSEKPRDLRHKE